MKKLLIPLILLIACQKRAIYNETVKPYGIVIDTISIERKSIGNDYATNVIFSGSQIGTSAYSLVDKHFKILSKGKVYGNLLSALSLERVKRMEFTLGPELTYYTAFGNWVYVGNEQYIWVGRSGTSHVRNGRRTIIPYNSLIRKQGNKFRYPRVDMIDERGGGSKDIDGQINAFFSLYDNSSLPFTHIVWAKSTDLTGREWLPEDTILYRVGTNGGVDETTHPRFNVYSELLEIGTKLLVPWFEHDGRGHWRMNYLYRGSKDESFVSMNIPQGPTDKLGEGWFADLGNGMVICWARQNAKAPIRQSVCMDINTLPHVWSEWRETNIGSGMGHVMACGIKTTMDGVCLVYGDRGTSTMKASIRNDIGTIISNPKGYNPGVTIYTAGPEDIYGPLGYPTMKEVYPGRYLVGFSVHINDNKAYFITGEGGW